MDFQQSLKLGNLLGRMDRFGRNCLGTVDAATAAQGHNGLAAIFLICLVAQFHIVGGRIGGIKGLEGVSDAAGIKALQHRPDLSPANHAGAGNHQHIVNTLCF